MELRQAFHNIEAWLLVLPLPGLYLEGNDNTLDISPILCFALD